LRLIRRQACLAGLPPDQPQGLPAAIGALDCAALKTCLSEVCAARHGWLLLASA
jgi:hypothetical protein